MLAAPLPVYPEEAERDLEESHQTPSHWEEKEKPQGILPRIHWHMQAEEHHGMFSLLWRDPDRRTAYSPKQQILRVT